MMGADGSGSNARPPPPPPGAPTIAHINSVDWVTSLLSPSVQSSLFAQQHTWRLLFSGPVSTSHYTPATLPSAAVVLYNASARRRAMGGTPSTAARGST
jgi:hypothetical protein